MQDLFGFGNLIELVLYRDAYGFAVRPQHVQRYREYANIYKVFFYFWLFFLVLSLNTYFLVAEKKTKKRILEFMCFFFFVLFFEIKSKSQKYELGLVKFSFGSSKLMKNLKFKFLFFCSYFSATKQSLKRDYVKNVILFYITGHFRKKRRKDLIGGIFSWNGKRSQLNCL